MSREALETKKPVSLNIDVKNVNRTVGTMLGSELTRRHGGDGLPDDTITINFRGSAGQSFGAFVPKGMTMILTGDANDYVGKGLSGGRIIVKPDPKAPFVPRENIIAGNVIGYGATSGEILLRGKVGERFCVRNSGVHAVVEGVGDHGCEYMTGGRVVVLGETGRNFAAGMSGGIAYVFDGDSGFHLRCNKEMVALEDLDNEDLNFVYQMLEKHVKHTDSALAKDMLKDWKKTSAKFRKVMPVDFKRVLLQAREKAAAAAAGE
jgi:glutamate synthase (NADPH/NADH) large chain